MFDVQLAQVEISVTSGRPHTPEEIAEIALKKIIYVGKDLPPEIQSQAESYRKNLYHILLSYIKMGERAERSLVLQALDRADMKDAAAFVRSL